mmetsp:Transcript_487/g.491  ORF Transcript_487/g.491 Transcript_487/m.491 type:complete len:85 (+) Transcript_487:2155-2409(+)
MVMFVQLVYMATSDLTFHSEKLEAQKYYQGELCDLIGNYESRRCVILISFLFAVVFKIYNSHYYYYLDIHVEARQKNCKVEDVI